MTQRPARLCAFLSVIDMVAPHVGSRFSACLRRFGRPAAPVSVGKRGFRVSSRCVAVRFRRNSACPGNPAAPAATAPTRVGPRFARCSPPLAGSHRGSRCSLRKTAHAGSGFPAICARRSPRRASRHPQHARGSSARQPISHPIYSTRARARSSRAVEAALPPHCGFKPAHMSIVRAGRFDSPLPVFRETTRASVRLR